MGRIATPPACHVCESGLAPSQEYCLKCGARVLGGGRLGLVPAGRGRVLAGIGFLAAVTVAAAAVAVIATRDAVMAKSVITAIGGSRVASSPIGQATAARTLTAWPGADGWTIALASVPKVEGRDRALALVLRARPRELGQVGILDTNQFASLHPGYWLVFAGIYRSEAAATGSLRTARRVSRTARVQQIAR